jgi:hypothetical protein
MDDCLLRYTHHAAIDVLRPPVLPPYQPSFVLVVETQVILEEGSEQLRVPSVSATERELSLVLADAEVSDGLLSAGTFSACHDEYHGSPDGLLGML